MKKKQPVRQSGILVLWGLLGSLVFCGVPLASETGTGDSPASQRKVLSLFEREGCGHCRKERAFLEELQRSMPGLEVQWMSLEEPEVRELFDTFTARYDLPKVTPITIVGRKFIIGFDGPETTGVEIKRVLESEEAVLTVPDLLTGSRGVDIPGMGGTCSIGGPATECEPSGIRLPPVHIPFFGPVDLSRLTLPLLSLVLGLVDGFNPCAMWVLVAFLTALAQVGSIRKMIQFAGIFILAQGIMYLVILNSWFLAFDFIQADRIVTPVIGLVAIGGGLFFLWEFARSDASCKVTGFEQRSRTLSRLSRLAKGSFTPVAVAGILAVAFSVNVVEFACSIGIPQAFTKILDLNEVSLWYREALMGIYVLSYMMDDLAVFAVAIWSMEKIGITTRYSHISNLAGGIIMLILGLLLILAPEKLRFLSG
jgi:cytochrome c biogenesis protein CcdA